MAERQKRLVLNVDDDEAGRYAMSRILKQAGFDVSEAPNGQEALRLAVEKRPDLILLDVRLPDIDGFEVCRRLKSDTQTRLIPVVHVTASYVESSYQTRGLEGGADGYLVEPVDPAFLVASVKSMLRIRDAEREVHKYARAWQSTFDSIQDGIAVIDSAGGVIQANARFRSLFGDGEFAKVMAAYGSSPVAPQEVNERSRKDGHYARWEIKHGETTLEISLSGIQDLAETRGSVCVVRDVTEHNKIEDNLRFTQKLESVGVLAGGIAHDFNNLLTGILGNASLALDERNLPEAVRPLLQQVVSSSERAADLTRQLLAYAGKGRFFEEDVDISKLVRETLSLIRTNLVSHEVRLNLNPTLPMVRADATQIRQLLMNLIINASEAMGKTKGTIAITTKVMNLDDGTLPLFHKYSLAAGRYVSVEVEDSGVGMDEETQERIFDPFFTTKFLGRGLGLSATLGIVRGHKGAIRVVSTVGKGSLFHVIFPMTEVKDEKQDLPMVEPAPVHGTILIAEDEESVRSMMTSVLERDGHTVVMAVNGLDCLHKFKMAAGTIDLVIVDLTMPVMGGEETIRGLLGQDPSVNIIVCTGHSTSDAMELDALGVVGVLAKPFRGSFLRAEVRKYLLKDKMQAVR